MHDGCEARRINNRISLILWMFLAGRMAAGCYPTGTVVTLDRPLDSDFPGDGNADPVAGDGDVSPAGDAVSAGDNATSGDAASGGDGGGPSTGIVHGPRLDDFDTASSIYVINSNGSSATTRDLWSQYPSGDLSGAHLDVGTVVLSNEDSVDGGRSLEMSATDDPAETGDGNPASAYVQFYTHDESNWNFVRDVVTDLGGTWETNRYNRFVFYIKPPAAATLADAGLSNFSVGTYYASQAAGGPTSSNAEAGGGNHGYHRFNLLPGVWNRVVLDHNPTHIRGADGNAEQPLQEYPIAADAGSYNYFDLLTRLYFSFGRGYVFAHGQAWYFDRFEFFQETRPEALDSIYGFAAAYDPGRNLVSLSWNRHKEQNDETYEIRYAFSDIHDIGFDKATWLADKTRDNWGGYNLMLYQTDQLDLGGHNVIYLAVRTVGESVFHQIALDL